MKKLLILLDTDEWKVIKRFKEEFLKTPITISSNKIQIFEVDEENHMERIV